MQVPYHKVIWSISIATGISGLALLLVLLKLDPYESVNMALGLFFPSAFFFLSGLFSLLLYFLKKATVDPSVMLKHIFISLRQGGVLSLCTLLCLALLMLGLLRIWNGLLIVSIMTLVEFYLSRGEEF